MRTLDLRVMRSNAIHGRPPISPIRRNATPNVSTFAPQLAPEPRQLNAICMKIGARTCCTHHQIARAAHMSASAAIDRVLPDRDAPIIVGRGHRPRFPFRAKMLIAPACMKMAAMSGDSPQSSGVVAPDHVLNHPASRQKTYSPRRGIPFEGDDRGASAMAIADGGVVVRL